MQPRLDRCKILLFTGVSLTPCFSWVSAKAHPVQNRFNGFKRGTGARRAETNPKYRVGGLLWWGETPGEPQRHSGGARLPASRNVNNPQRPICEGHSTHRPAADKSSPLPNITAPDLRSPRFPDFSGIQTPAQATNSKS